MTRVILDIPKDKLSKFIQSIIDLGIDKHAISASKNKNHLGQAKMYRPAKFVLFDWEFFSNELEYE